MKNTIRILRLSICVAFWVSTLSGCSGRIREFDWNREVGAISREDGSGTRGAFEELFGIGRTTDNAVITNSTAVMLTTVSSDMHSIGYVSLGSINDSVKAIKIDGVAPTIATVKSGEYKIARSLNIVTKNEPSKLVQDFIDFALSEEGGKIAEENGYVSVSKGKNYKATNTSGKITISGSSSVAPLVEKLKEAYEKLNKKVSIEVQQSDSSTGVTDAIDGTSDIGMASRELKESEIQRGVEATVIAKDGIAVIVNPNSDVEDLKKEKVKRIFENKKVIWKEVLT